MNATARQPGPGELQPLFNLYNAGRLAEAVNAARQLAARYPAAVVVHSVLGSALAALGRLDEAEQAFAGAVKANPGSAELLSNLGLVQQQRGRLQEALATYTRALAIRRDFPELLYNLGVVQDALGRLDEAATSYRRAIALQPRFAVALFNLGSVLDRQGARGEAIEVYRRAVEAEPGFVEAWSNLGAALQQSGEAEQAVRCYQKALDIQPTATAWFNLGTAQRAFGLIMDAAESYRRAIALAPEYADAHSNLGEILRDQGDGEGTLAAFRAALAIDPDHGGAHYNLGLLHHDLHEYDKALPCFEKAGVLDADDRVLYCLYKLRRSDEFEARLQARLGERHRSPMLATLSAHHATNRRRPDPYRFCPDPIALVHHARLDPLTDPADSLRSDLLRDITQADIQARKQGRLHYGVQSSGHLFRRPEASIARLVGLIRDEIERYRQRLIGEDCVYAQDFPPTTEFASSWYVKMSRGGHLTSHIHEEGWLSGVLYLAMPSDRPEGSTAGGIEFSTDGDDYPREHDDFPRRTLLPEVGDIVLFPSSLFHRTIPFQSNEVRICIAFDVKPAAAGD